MKKRKRSLVLEIALSDRETFKVLPDKKQQKNIYDKVRNKLVRKGYEGEALKYEMINAIRQELFRLQPQFKAKEPQKIKEESNFLNDKNFRIHGVDIWGEHTSKIDPVQQLEDDYNRTVQEGFQGAFCPRCKSNPCICRYEENEGDEN
jgi:hypothetical protein